MPASRTGFTPADIKDTGSLVKKLCQSLIRSSITAPFLARVTMVTDNTVTVTPIDMYETMEGAPMTSLPIYNMLVGMPYSSKVQVTMPIQVGDVGLCIVCNSDLDNYKETGMEGLPPTKRRFDPVDSVFIPLSMYNQESILTDYVFKYLSAPMVESLVLTLSGQNAISLQAGQGGSVFSLEVADNGTLTYNLSNGTVQIEISSQGSLTYTDTSQNQLTIDSQGISIQDANQNKVELTSSGVDISTSGGTKISMTSSAVDINSGALKVSI